MFELLLQADKALADGALDQAEKTYWQLIELDPTNAIAVAGLARVSLERGDERSARTFADRALGIDPESIAARRVLETLSHPGHPHDAQAPAELPLLAAQRLEALSRRRGRGDEAVEGAGKAKPAAPTETQPPQTRGKKVGSRPVPGARPAAGAPRGAVVGHAAGTSTGSSGRTRPDQIGPLPSEPLRERRQAGRLAAAAAAAAAAAREPVRARHEPHHAMPIGRRLFQPGDLKAPPADAFSEAEMAAAVEAVDALDDTNVTAATSGAVVGQVRTTPAEAGRVGDLTDLLGAIDATDADESVALRIALVADATELQAAELEAAEATDTNAWRPGDGEPGADEFEAAEAVAQSQAGRDLGPRPAGSHAGESATGKDAFAAAEAEAAAFLAVELEDADAAEAAAAREAVREVAGAAAATGPEPAIARKSFKHPGGEEPSEEEAEAQALREAIAMVLDGEGQIGGPEVPALPGGAAEPTGPTDAAGEQAAAEPALEPPAQEPPEAANIPGSPPRKQGLFGRIRGS